MSEPTCEKCGNEIVPGMRFCRKCGAPTGVFEDATTRALDSTPPIGAPTTVLNSGATGPAYIKPEARTADVMQPEPKFIAPPPPAPIVQQIQPPAKKSKVVLVLVLLAALVVIAVTACIAVYIGMGDGNVRTQSTSVNEVPSTPTTPGSPETPSAPSPPTAPQPPESKSDLAYPGAKPGIAVSRQNKSMMRYSTTDSVEKVSAWYQERINATDIVRTPGGEPVILRSAHTTVIITADGHETDIMITQEK